MCTLSTLFLFFLFVFFFSFVILPGILYPPNVKCSNIIVASWNFNLRYNQGTSSNNTYLPYLFVILCAFLDKIKTNHKNKLEILKKMPSFPHYLPTLLTHFLLTLTLPLPFSHFNGMKKITTKTLKPLTIKVYNIIHMTHNFPCKKHTTQLYPKK